MHTPYPSSSNTAAALSLTAVPSAMTEEEHKYLLADKKHTVFFTGHRTLPTEHRVPLREGLIREIKNLCRRGYTTFLSGGALGFDQMAAMEVLRFKRTNPALRLYFLIPCRDQADRWTETEQEVYRTLLAHGDGIFLLQETHDADCMRLRNELLVGCAARGIAYYNPADIRSGTGMTYRMAEKDRIPVTNLFDKMPELLPPAPAAEDAWEACEDEDDIAEATEEEEEDAADAGDASV